MKLSARAWGLGLFVAIAAPVTGCEDKETTRIYVMGSGGAGGAVGSGGAGGGSGGAGAPVDGSTGGAPGDAAADAVADTGSQPATDVAPPVDMGAPDRGGPDPVPGGYTGKPWNGVPQQIPGIIQCELFDTGGEGVAYHDTEPLNRGSGELNLNVNTPQAMFRRAEGVDISFTKPPTDRYATGVALPANELYVGWTMPGEWLRYTVSVAQTGMYMISAHTSANNEASTISFAFEEGTKTPLLPIPRTGSWNIWQHVDNMAIVRLTAGVHVLTLKSETVGNNNFDYVTFTYKP